ncbi:hypothetical protein [Actinomadura rubrisoli]|uniref:Uncharacterized protein n=1 Tax=Actinomadura rubrisoli TaxID=2530368 RepID=A0A4R5BUI3_9ACTN|nr:hypothetical protein [Actinomadura rubrisoli]TDD90758.1 hypothetical protein E1298_12715 [Actinomadura rubrisoli]
MAPLLDPDARAARFHARLRARRRARRAAWRESGGDPAIFADIMRGHVKTGYLFYYEDEPEPAIIVLWDVLSMWC